jgi:cell division protease FtsH
VFGQNSRNFALWIVIALLLTALFNYYQGGNQQKTLQVAYSEFVRLVKEDKVKSVFIRGDGVAGQLSEGKAFSTYIPPQETKLLPLLKRRNIRIKAAPPEEGSTLLQILISCLPMLLLIGVWLFFLRQMQGGTGKTLGFGKSRARRLDENGKRVTFDDVAGIDEAKEELEEIVDFLKTPAKFEKLGGKIPKGVLLIGPPGTGKTLLARAIAGEANVPFFSISGSDFVEMFVGVGASRVRDMFEQAKQNAPCIIFVDEVDAVGRHRGSGIGGGNDEREQTLNQLLVEMDGFESSEGVILVAATNRPDVLDPALLRPGRFDRQVVVPNPDIRGREKILRVHMRKINGAPDVNPTVIARGTPGFSGADLANLVNEAALMAARKNRRAVSMADFESAKDKVMMGSERRSMVMTDEEKKLTAYHEAGHAIVSFYLPHSDPIHKATIIPRGRALGMVVRLPEGDRISVSKAKLEADIAVAMGGRIAELLIFGPDHVTTGASSDIKGATDIARYMVCEWGMSDKLGPMSYVAQGNETSFLMGRGGGRIADATSRTVDEEVRKILEGAYQIAHDLIVKHKKKLHALAEALIKYETLDGEGIEQLLTTGKLIRSETEAIGSLESLPPKKKPGRKKAIKPVTEGAPGT